MTVLFAFSVLVRFMIMENDHLQIRGIKKTDEGMYNCEARVMARGEIDFRMIKVVVNGKRCLHLVHLLLPVCPVGQQGVVARHSNDDPENPGNVLFRALNMVHQVSSSVRLCNSLGKISTTSTGGCEIRCGYSCSPDLSFSNNRS